MGMLNLMVYKMFRYFVFPPTDLLASSGQAVNVLKESSLNAGEILTGKCLYCDKSRWSILSMLTVLVMDFEFALAQSLHKFDRIIAKHTMPMVQMLVFLNVGGNINLCGNPFKARYLYSLSEPACVMPSKQVTVHAALALQHSLWGLGLAPLHAVCRAARGFHESALCWENIQREGPIRQRRKQAGVPDLVKVCPRTSTLRQTEHSLAHCSLVPAYRTRCAAS
ncbi:hypothetical protein EK904_013671 [Melospiza melodia maxima]|nr:hypothetical protein EK904_013671 [Melospiza melodia maxima]